MAVALNCGSSYFMTYVEAVIRYWSSKGQNVFKERDCGLQAAKKPGASRLDLVLQIFNHIVKMIRKDQAFFKKYIPSVLFLFSHYPINEHVHKAVPRKILCKKINGLDMNENNLN